MFSIIPFLVQWIALSYISLQSHENYYIPNQKSYWTLIEDFRSISEDEIEKFLPQICNILIEKNIPDEYGIYPHFERVLLDKCARCLPFGIRVCNILKGLEFSVINTNI